MIVLNSIRELYSLKGPIVLAAGTFDGLHLGHQALIRRALEESERIGGTPVVMTFDRHPASITRPGSAPKLLTRNEAKLTLLEELGVPVVLLLAFTPLLALVSAEEFIRSFPTSLHEVCVGSQWSFGHCGEGNIVLLKQLGKERGFTVASVAPVEIDGKPISSTRIRAAITMGNFAEATACLGRDYFLTGKIVPGDGIGSKIGFPTANLDAEWMQLPPDGVYAVRISLGNSIFHGVANLGHRPTLERSQPARRVEVHLFDFSEDIAGREIGVWFVEFIRNEQKFPNLKALVAQITLDCAEAKKLIEDKGESL